MPRTVIFVTHSIAGNGGGNCTDFPCAPLGLKMISLDLAAFIHKLSSAHAWMCFSSSSRVSSLAAGTTRYVSSAYFKTVLPLCTGRKLTAMMAQEAGPSAEPWSRQNYW